MRGSYCDSFAVSTLMGMTFNIFFLLMKKPQTNGACQVGWVGSGDAVHVDPRDQGIERQGIPFGSGAQRIPEQWLQADGGLMPGNGDAALDRPRKIISH